MSDMTPASYPYNAPTSPFRVLQRKDKHFVVNINGTAQSVSVDCLKPAFTVTVVPDTALVHGSRP